MKLGPNSKPHRNEPGYIAEMKCRTGGHIVIFDLDVRLPENREAGAKRWRVQHEPSSNGATVDTLKRARGNMKLLAKARTAQEAGPLQHIIPAFSDDIEREEPVKQAAPRRAQAEIDADLDTFMADPENEPSEAGIAARRRLFAS